MACLPSFGMRGSHSSTPLESWSEIFLRFWVSLLPTRCRPVELDTGQRRGISSVKLESEAVEGLTECHEIAAGATRTPPLTFGRGCCHEVSRASARPCACHHPGQLPGLPWIA